MVWLNPNDTPHCLVVDEALPYDAKAAERLREAAMQNYAYYLMVDDLPSASVHRGSQKNTTNHVDQAPWVIYDAGIPVARPVIKPGGPMKDELMVMNHLLITIETHAVDEKANGAIRIVGFEVEAKSINWGDDPCGREALDSYKPQLYHAESRVTFTYQVVFKKSELLWAHRFDHYLKLGKSDIHFWQFFVALLIAAAGTLSVYIILQRTISKDLEQVNLNRNALRRF